MQYNNYVSTSKTLSFRHGLADGDAVEHRVDAVDELKLDTIQFGTDLFDHYYLELRALILERSPDLLDVLQRVAVSERLIDQKEDGSAPEEDGVAEDVEDGQFEWIRIIVEPVMSEMVEFWFVTTVNIETALHLWDQLLLKR